MRLTYTDLKNIYLSNIGMDGSTDANILTQFQTNLGSRYQMILARMRDYETQKDITQTTVANQQYYQYPPGIVNIEGVVITIGNVHYPMTVVNSQWQWNWLNALQVQPTAIPQFILPRQSDYGIYPIPQTNGYSITFSYHYRDRNLSVEDYPTGSVTVTNGSATVTGSGTTFIPAMAGRWFVGAGPYAQQRFHIDLGSAKTIHRIYYENSHVSGGYTNRGFKTFTFWGSNTSGAFADLTYGTDTNWTQLTTASSTFDEHSASDTAVPKYITVTNSTAYQYYAFKFSDDWGASGAWSGVRRIVLQTEDVPPPTTNYLSSYRNDRLSFG